MSRSQYFDITPPRKSNGLTLTVDGTARAYDLGSLAWGGENWSENDSSKRIFLQIWNDSTVAIYFTFQDTTTVTLDQTSAVAAAGTPALDAAFCLPLQPQGSARLCVDRVLDRYLVVKAASGSSNLLRVYAASPPDNY